MSVDFSINEDLFVCPYCEKKYKKKIPYEKHILNCSKNKNFDINTPPNEIQEEKEKPKSLLTNFFSTKEQPLQTDNIQKLRDELLNLCVNNNIDLNKPINNNFTEKINSMSVDELKMRIIQAKKVLNDKMDYKLSNQILNISNLIIGKFLNCLDELNTEVEKDLLLKDSVKSVCSESILNKLTPTTKIGALYSLNIASAMNKAKDRIETEKQKEASTLCDANELKEV
jgi:uncharacterized C2H2 Zn-finger protein